MQKASSFGGIEWGKYDLLLHGAAVDERGAAAIKESAARSKTSITLSYDSQRLQMIIDGCAVDSDDFGAEFAKFARGTILLETTTLGFVEILLCCRELQRIGLRSFDLLYVEPNDYRSPRRRHLLHRRDFELSGSVPGFQGIPGHSILLADRTAQKGVFFVGYEEARLRRAFEELQMIRPDKAAIAFGIPAFKAGWEMDSMANNITVIREQNCRGGVHFCGAANPLVVLELLNDIYLGLDGSRLFIAPIGTKPHGVGVALFASKHTDVGIIYDHPRRSAGRSREIAHWHLYSVAA